MRVLAGATAGLLRILDFLLVALVGLVLLGVLLGKVAPLTGRQTMIVGGSSMEPAIGLGAAVIVASVSADELRIGDVVSLRAGDKNAIFTHRIVSVVDRPDGRWIGTKGDANAEPDPTIIPASAVIGRSELSIPYAGYLLQLLSIPTGILFLVGLAATLLAAASLLETLELERARGPVAAPDPADDPNRGEPTALRAAWLREPAVNGTFAPFRRATAHELAVARAARQRRGPTFGSMRRAPRRPH